MSDLDVLQEMAKNIPINTTAILPEHIQAFANALREEILACNEPGRLRCYISAALDVECLSILAEISEMAPLNDIAYQVLVSLTCSVFTEAGLAIPREAQEEYTLLGATEKAWLEDLRKDIREAQNKAGGIEPRGKRV
jgi:hypothetical protein